MVLEEQILRFSLKIYSYILVIFFFISSIYTLYSLNKNLNLVNEAFTIQKGESIHTFYHKNIKNLNSIDLFIVKIYFNLFKFISNTHIHYGDFILEKNISSIQLLNIISRPSNVLNKITIVEGWSQEQLNNELSKFFDNINIIPYEDIIADTYYFNRQTSFENFIQNLITYKIDYFRKYENNDIYKFYNTNEIIIIGSLLEKEGLDSLDKKKISSVIFNRLEKNMKLQIDATVIFAITNGKYNLNRKLVLNDLKFDHPYNTYIYKGLPPKPISYVGKKTLDLIFENHKSDFLFYFFDKSLNRHIFSKSYKDHKLKLNDYRNK